MQADNTTYGKIPCLLTNPGSQTLGKVDLEDIFSGVVSTELGPSLETQRHRGRHKLRR